MTLKTALIAAACLAVSAPVLAVDEHHPDEPKKPAATKPAAKALAKPPAGAKPGAAMMDMGKMQEQMKQMQAQMEKIRATSDPKERQRLLAEHMKAMHEGMGMMQGMMGGGMGMGMGPGPRADAMEKRMDMMQMMMQQMMEHEQAEQPPAR